MFSHEKIDDYKNKEDFYRLLTLQIQSVLEDETDVIANMANISAVLFSQLKNVNWCGFYLTKGDELVLGPFQGKAACTRIKIGVGVCGTAVKEDKVQVVENVHEFASHIACDCDTNSEIVIPLYENGKCVGVLDIDSPIFARFDGTDEKYLSQIAKMIYKQ